MSDRPDRLRGKDTLAEDIAPETDNAEQDGDAAEQAQTVTEEALTRRSDAVLGDSDKVPSGDDSDDVQDLVDHMNQMVSSGRIDMDAFRGEPDHDDNVDKFGPQSKVDPLRGDGT